MLDYDISADIKGVTGRLRMLTNRQVPFATANALTSTAFDARKEFITRTWPRAFKVRQRGLAGRMFRVKKATKRRLTASVYDSLGRDWLRRQIKGGVKRPFGGRSIAIPLSEKQVRRGKAKKIGKPGQFVYTNRAGNRFIAKRKGKRKVNVLFALANKASVRRRLPLFKDGEWVVKRVFRRHFEKSFAYANRTAR